MKVKLLIATQKENSFPVDDIYLPVHVGAACGRTKTMYQRDDAGDNISGLNPYFCELTALYWAWKNLDFDWLGLVHYRRMFSWKKHPAKSIDSCITSAQLFPLLTKYRVIVPQKRYYYIETVYSHYSHTFDGTQLDKAREIISDFSPEYLSDFDTVMHRRSSYVFNMMVMSHELVDAYCSWVFPILFALTDKVDTSSMSPFEKRFAGRVSERLFNVWLEHMLSSGQITKAEIKELPCIYLGKVNWGKKITGFLRAKFLGEKYKASF